MTRLAGIRICVVGAGTSGLAATRLCLARGARVTLTDTRARSAVGSEVLALEAAGARLALGGHHEAGLDACELVIVSPGVPMFSELARAEAGGVRIWGEVELATRCLASEAPVIAVGGTNGKSTVTSLLAHVLAADGRRVFAGGNLGEPLSDHVDEAFDAVVLEVSSFQMERVDAFRPRVSILLNITPDHLDRYPGLDAYARAKGNAFARQTARDLAIVPHGDARCLAEARRGAGRVLTFGASGDALVTLDAVLVSGERYERGAFGVQGGHNALNAAAAILALHDLGVAPGTIRGALATFHGLAHRMALVRTVGGVRFYDDSKGTNVGASVTALLGVPEARVVLVAGGRDKGGSYAPLAEALREKGRAAVLIGEARDLIAGALGLSCEVALAETMEDAVAKARALARPGDAVLLSPACSSFDMFRDYKHRGDVFAAAVHALEEPSP